MTYYHVTLYFITHCYMALYVKPEFDMTLYVITYYYVTL
jgi:hypothetical protein